MNDKQNATMICEPVLGFPIQFEWQTNEWLQLFDEQVQLIQEDIDRARADNRSVVYLSCPISNRGGGYFVTNVEIAKYTQHRLMTEWGSGFWILNPAQYQMESKEGTGLIYRHARNLEIAQERVKELPPPGGGDYMRMWTKVLVEDDESNKDGEGNIGRRFDAFYFLGPRDTREFFSPGQPERLTTSIEEYFAAKFSTDAEFRMWFSSKEPDDWEKLRRDFVRFYGLRAGCNYSKGAHDEWNILVLLNQKRLKLRQGGIGSQIAAYFDGVQVAPGAAETAVFRGYARTMQLGLDRRPLGG